MRWFISVLAVLVLVAVLWWLEQKQQAELVPELNLEVPAEPQQPEPRHPLPRPETQLAPGIDERADGDISQEKPQEPEPETESPLPALTDSDTAILAALSDLFGDKFVQRWIKPEFVIARTVSIINSLDGEAPALKTRPVKTLDSEPLTKEIENGETLRWTKANAGRYESLVSALESVTPGQAATRYARYYPLIQQAWNELGEAEPYFNDRLIDIIDHLLATPEVPLPFEVVPYEGQLHFADESLQEQSWGRKLLLRMGPDQATEVKHWLQDFRQALASP